ncbi:hypothetical protein A3Q56_05577 [Intoshia linei]|uniref:HORMA domain-containing protein n=1 Tax=Intoshia linei TaxID=1819745 RepID=A0A177AZU9_9BILA|nr:hypothetical protein A3Q56_05577 [Intoshia linei]
MSQAQSLQTAISIKGSTQIVSDFFYYGINSILYQREIYPPESFKIVNKYDLKLLVTADDKLNKYFEDILGQINNWLNEFIIKKFVVAIKNLNNSQVVERWQFDIKCENKMTETENITVDMNLMQQDIRAIIRQITASVSFLPNFNFPCNIYLAASSDKLIYSEHLLLLTFYSLCLFTDKSFLNITG